MARRIGMPKVNTEREITPAPTAEAKEPKAAEEPKAEDVKEPKAAGKKAK